MSFAPRFLLLFTLVIFPWGCGQDTESPPDDTSQTALDFADESLAGELDDAQAQKLLRHLERGEVQEATALLAQLNLDEPKNEKVRVLLMSLYLLNGNESAARALITSSWPAGAMWFDRLKARHAQKGLLSDLTTYLGQRLQRPQGAFNPNTAPQASGAALPQMPAPTLGYDLIPLQRSEVNNSLNVAFEVDCQTDITIDGQGTVDIATEATQKNGQEFTPPSTPTMKRSHQLKGVMHWEMFQNNNQSDVWAKMHWQDGGSKIDLPIEMDDQHRYATSGLLSEELERQNLVLRFSPHKELKAIYAADTYSPDLIRMFLNIFDSMNVNTPRENGLRTPLPNEWSQETYDGTGRYGSTYQITERHHGKLNLVKTKSAYTAVSQARPEETNYLLNSVDQLQTQGLQQMVWQPDEELVISTTGDIILDINSELMKFHSETHISLERIPVDPTWEHPPTASLAALRTQVQNWSALPMTENLPAALKNQDERFAQRELEPEEEEIVQRQIEGFLDQTRPIWTSSERPDPKQVKAIGKRLNDFGTQHPRTAMKVFEAHIKKFNFRSTLTSLMMRVAATHGGDEGAALIEKVILAPTAPMTFRSSGIMSLGTSKHLSAKGEEVLRELVLNPYHGDETQLLTRQAAALIANEVRKENNPAIYQRAVSLLVSELGKADQVVRLRQLLEGLGNAGHPKTVNAVKPFLNHPHKFVKVAAFHSLRLNHSVEATRAYVDALVERSHPRYIRNRVMPLVGHMKMTPQLMRRYGAYLKKEGRETLLLDALDALAKHGDMAQPVIEQFVAHRSQKVAAKARTLLAGGVQ